MINKSQFQKYIIEFTLRDYSEVRPSAYSDKAVQLMMGTAAIESQLGEYIVQLGDGPAKGFMQVEQATALDNWVNWLRYNKRDANHVGSVLSTQARAEIFNELGDVRKSINPSRVLDDELTLNIRYNVLMARIKYIRSPKPLPDHNDVYAMANYWEVVYQGDPSRTIGETAQDFVEKYELYVSGRVGI